MTTRPRWILGSWLATIAVGLLVGAAVPAAAAGAPEYCTGTPKVPCDKQYVNEKLGYVRGVLGIPGDRPSGVSPTELDRAIACLCELVATHPVSQRVERGSEGWGNVKVVRDYTPYLDLAWAWSQKAKASRSVEEREKCYRKVLAAAGRSKEERYEVRNKAALVARLVDVASRELRAVEEAKIAGQVDGWITTAREIFPDLEIEGKTPTDRKDNLVAALRGGLETYRSVQESAYRWKDANAEVPEALARDCSDPGGEDVEALLARVRSCKGHVGEAIAFLEGARRGLCGDGSFLAACRENVRLLQKLLGKDVTVPGCPDHPGGSTLGALKEALGGLRALSGEVAALRASLESAEASERERLGDVLERWKLLEGRARDCRFDALATAIAAETRKVRQVRESLGAENLSLEARLVALEAARGWTDVGSLEQKWLKQARDALAKRSDDYGREFPDPLFEKVPAAGHDLAAFLETARATLRKWDARYDFLLGRDVEKLREKLDACAAAVTAAWGIHPDGRRPTWNVNGHDAKRLRAALESCQKAKQRWESDVRLSGEVDWDVVVDRFIGELRKAEDLVRALSPGARPAALAPDRLAERRHRLEMLRGVLDAPGRREILEKAGVELPGGVDGIEIEAVRGAAVRRLLEGKDPGEAVSALQGEAADLVVRASLVRALAAYAHGDLDGAIACVRAVPVPGAAGARARFARHALLGWFLDLRARAFRQQGVASLAERLEAERDGELAAAHQVRSQGGIRGEIPWVFPAMRRLLESQPEVAREGAARGGTL